jgi:hypothetical protein
MKSFPTPAGDTKKKQPSLRELLRPDDSGAGATGAGDSDYEELLCQESDSSSSASGSPRTAASGNYFATAESVTVDELLEDVDYVDESDMKEMKQLFERIRGRVKRED